MNYSKKILTAFLLNLAFSVFEFIGGAITGSVAIFSDALHDLGDALSVGISYLCEKKSKKKPDNNFTYGYSRYSVLGGFITSLTLLCGSIIVIQNAVSRMINPVEINHHGMIFISITGVCINFIAAFITHGGTSFNHKAVSLHMLEDVLGWIVVLAGAFIIKFTNFTLIDPLLSIGVAVYIIIHASEHIKEALYIFLDKVPDCIDITELKKQLTQISGIIEVHHIHVRSIDEHNNCATIHVITNSPHPEIKQKIREKLLQYGITHITLELEDESESSAYRNCPNILI